MLRNQLQHFGWLWKSKLTQIAPRIMELVRYNSLLARATISLIWQFRSMHVLNGANETGKDAMIYWANVLIGYKISRNFYVSNVMINKSFTKQQFVNRQKCIKTTINCINFNPIEMEWIHSKKYANDALETISKVIWSFSITCKLYNNNSVFLHCLHGQWRHRFYSHAAHFFFYTWISSLKHHFAHVVWL